MAPQLRSERCQSTNSTATPGSTSSNVSAKKRKSMASSTEQHQDKRIKTEKISLTEPKASKRVDMVADTIYDVVVTIKVGEAATNFGIHRGLLRSVSSFFKEHLSTGETTEDGIAAQSISIKAEDPAIFRRFNTWLYSEKIISGSETYKTLPWEVIIEVYSFAERKGIPRLQNNCVDTVIQKRRDGGLFPGHADINTLWKRTGNFWSLRRLLLDLFATGCNLTKAITSNGSYHPQFLQGLMQTLYEMKANGTVYDRVDFWERRANYYVDDSENPIVVD